MTQSMFFGALGSGLAIGALGGATIVAMRRGGRRVGASYLVYVVVLALGLMLSHTTNIPSRFRFSICFYSVHLSLLIAIMTDCRRAARTGVALVGETRLLLNRRAALWGIPIVYGLMIGASQGVAYLTS